jgi:hypothetical protein
MKIKNIFISILCILPLISMAQPDQRKQLEADRVGVYSRVLNLTPDEARLFWPIFNEFQSQMESIQRESKDIRRNAIKNYNKMSDAELDKTIEATFNQEQKQLDLKRKYTKEFKKALPVKKVILLQKAEREFKKELIHKLKERKDSNDE